ncbi:MAG: heme o synthase [Bdellovibrionales bacterium]
MDSTLTQNNVTQTSESTVSDYFALLKPKVMSLVIFTGFAGMWVAPGLETTHPFLAFVAMLCLALGAGAAGAINMWFDRDIDAIMDRTKERPIPTGKINPDEALTFGCVLSVFSCMMMGVAMNWTAAGLLAFANLFYVLIYTIWLKRSTPQNIVIGGAAGAFPPVIGWAAITGDITLYPIIMFAIIFMWTPPHFWALSLFANEDYKRAKIPMMTVTAGAKKTKIQMLAYTLLLFPITLSPWFLGFENVSYGIAASILSGLFLISAIRVYKSDENDNTFKDAKIMFGYSVFYLFALFLALMLL